MLVGRPQELDRIDALLDGALDDSDGCLFVHGEAGIGKTALLDEGCERAHDRGFLVLRASGIEGEAELAYSSLADLVRPLLDRLDDLPTPQADALRGALALGPPAEGGRFAACAALHGLISRVATDQPVAVVIDDGQWVDAESRECIHYTCRRRPRGGVFLIAARLEPDEPLPPGLPEMGLERLDTDSARQLLRARQGDIAPADEDRLLAIAEGNPLALNQLSISDAETSDARATFAELSPPARAVGSALADKIAPLPEPAQLALLIAATAQSSVVGPIAAACVDAGIAFEEIEPAEAAGLVRLDSEHVAFTHPLARAAVVSRADPAARRRAHRLLADTTPIDERAWHLAASSLGPDEEAAEALVALAKDSLDRRGGLTAGAALARAAELSEDDDRRQERLLSASQAYFRAGGAVRALELAERAGEIDGGDRDALDHHLATLHFFSGNPTLLRELAPRAREVAERDAERGAEMLADVASSMIPTNDIRVMEEHAAEAFSLLGDKGDSRSRSHVLSIRYSSLTYRGRIDEAAEVFDELAQLVHQVDPDDPNAHMSRICLYARLASGEFERTRADSLRWAKAARERGSMAALPVFLMAAGDAAYRLGEWDAAEADLADAHRGAIETGQFGMDTYLETFLTRIAAARGRPEAKELADKSTAVAEQFGIPFLDWVTRAASGFAHLSANRMPEAIADLERARDAVGEGGRREHLLVPWLPDLVEAYVHTGRRDDAELLMADYLESMATAPPAARSVAARCQGLLAGGEGDSHFEEALALDDEQPMPFERARTCLAWGGELHRARRRSDAREHLRDAEAGFVALGATPWAERAQEEIRAAGGRRRKAPSDALTSQEERIAQAAAEGATNREIADALYLSPKTVEFHLGNIYRKLGISSRRALIGRLVTAASAPRGE